MYSIPVEERITIVKRDITQLDTDAVVNAANSALKAGSGVCGAIFQAAGAHRLEKACGRIGHCDTGSTVITSTGSVSSWGLSTTITRWGFSMSIPSMRMPLESISPL